MITVKNWGYLAALVHFEIVATENGEKPKSDISSTQPSHWQFYHIYLKIYVYEGGKYHELVKNILVCNSRFFKIQDGSQLRPIEGVNTMFM